LGYGDKSSALGTGTTRGVYGYATGGETNYGGYFETGNTWGTGIGLYASGGNYAAMFRGNVQIQNSIGTTVMEFGDVGNYIAMFRGNVQIQNSGGTTVMELGDGLDYAEGFDVSEPSQLSAGTVLVIDPDNSGKLMVSSSAYDTKVAGIVAGANGLGSGVRLGSDQFDSDVALAGRVYCNVDATESAIQPGDLLTTASLPGYAMKATDYSRAQGAILGKAMEKLEKGKKGQILVLVTLQ